MHAHTSMLMHIHKMLATERLSMKMNPAKVSRFAVANIQDPYACMHITIASDNACSQDIEQYNIKISELQ